MTGSLGMLGKQRQGSPNHTQEGWGISQGFPGKDSNRQCLLNTLNVLGMRLRTLHGLIILLYHHSPSRKLQWDFLSGSISNVGGAWALGGGQTWVCTPALPLLAE